MWHDNSGKGADASWFLKYAIVIDLQTKEKFYFLCEKWLAIDKEDGMIDRVLAISGDKQKKEFSYLLAKQAKYKLADGHLWLSVFARPAMSTFTRIDRLTCCFVFLSINMLMNIMYYDTNKTTSPNALKMGPFIITPEQVLRICELGYYYFNTINLNFYLIFKIGIGVITNLIVIPPSILLINLFRKSRPKSTKLKKFRKKMIKNHLSKKLLE